MSRGESILRVSLFCVFEISRLEATRDLSQKIVHVDMDAFVSRGETTSNSS